MLYSILIQGSEARTAAWTPEEDAEVMGRHAQLRTELTAQGRLGPVMRLTPGAATTVRRVDGRLLATDGPFAESKEQLMGIYVVQADTLDAVLDAVRQLDFDGASFEIRPLLHFEPGGLPPLLDVGRTT
jgi:hypothetical protein